MNNPIPEQREQWDDDMSERDQELADKKLFEGTTFASANAEFDDAFHSEDDLPETEWCDDYEGDDQPTEQDELQDFYGGDSIYDDVGDQDWG